MWPVWSWRHLRSRVPKPPGECQLWSLSEQLSRDAQSGEIIDA
jgi:hypothetical protein